MEQLIDIQKLHVTYGGDDREVVALNGIDMLIGHGQVAAVVGESGSGKTTLGMSIMRLLNTDNLQLSGKVFFEGQDLLAKKSREMEKIRGKDIGMIFQEPLSALNPAIIIGEQIDEVLKIHGFKDKNLRKERVLKVMEDAGLPNPLGYYNYYPYQLSGGLKQRSVIAMAIACSPKLVIADEPTTALDVTIQAQILSLLKRLQQEKGLSILLITHDFGVVAEIADTVTVMYLGNILEQGPVAEVLKKPCHPYTAGLMKCIPYIGKKQEWLYTIPRQEKQLVTGDYKGCIFYDRCFMGRKECKEDTPALRNVDGNHQTCCPYWKEL